MSRNKNPRTKTKVEYVFVDKRGFFDIYIKVVNGKQVGPEIKRLNR